MERIRSIDLFSIATGIFAYFVVPLVPLLALGSAVASHVQVVPNSLLRNPYFYVELWFLTLAPFLSGYMVAKLSRRQPLLHGFLTGIAGAILFVSWFLCFGSRASIPLSIIGVLFAVLGAWLWRVKARRAKHIRVV